MARLVTDIEALRMCQLYRAGHSLAAVARKTNRSCHAVKRALIRYEVPVRSWQQAARLRHDAKAPEPKPKRKRETTNPRRFERFCFYGGGPNDGRGYPEECEVESWDQWNEGRAS